MILSDLFRSTRPVPDQYRSNFLHLYLDIGWFGILSGSAVNFLNVIAVRLGASNVQVGLLTAAGAAISLFLAIPAGRWLEKRPIDKAVFRTAALYRLGFLLMVPLPWLFNAQGQVWGLIALSFLMGIPLTVVAIGFSALFAASVPEDWRAHVVGVRNAVLSVTFMLTSLLSGFLLDKLPNPLNYQVIFGIGFLGAAMSTLHLYFVRPIERPLRPDQAHPGSDPTTSGADPRPGWIGHLRLDIWRSPFRRVLLALLAFHLTQYLAIPLFPIAYVRFMKLTDNQIGIGTMIFYLLVFLGSTQISRLVARSGNRRMTGLGLIGLGVYPLMLAYASDAWHFYVISAVGGAAWAILGGTYGNYLIENLPAHDRPAHMAWYNFVLNACVLFGSLAGPLAADLVGLSAALVIFGFLRAAAGFAVWKWG
jgi:MFS family permease